MRDYSTHQIRGCLRELEREQRELGLTLLAATQAAIGAALGDGEAAGKVIEAFTSAE